MPIKNSIETIGNRTRDLTACSGSQQINITNKQRIKWRHKIPELTIFGQEIKVPNTIKRSCYRVWLTSLLLRLLSQFLPAVLLGLLCFHLRALAGIAQSVYLLGYGLDVLETVILFPSRVSECSILFVQTVPWVHIASCSLGTRGPFLLG